MDQKLRRPQASDWLVVLSRLCRVDFSGSQRRVHLLVSDLMTTRINRRREEDLQIMACQVMQGQSQKGEKEIERGLV